MNAYGFEPVPLGGDYISSALTILMIVFLVYNVKMMFTPYKGEKKEENREV